MAGRRGVPAGPRGVHEHGWPPAPGTGTAGSAGSGPAAPGGLRAVRHVWVIELENQGYAQSFGTPSAIRTWPGRCRRWGPCWRTTTRWASSAANYVAQVSGQAPNIATQSDCGCSFAGQVIAGPYSPRSSARAASTRRRSRRSATSCQPPGAAGRRTCRTWATTPSPGQAARTSTVSRARGPRLRQSIHLGHLRPSLTLKARNARSGAVTDYPPATTGSRSSARSPATRPTATRTSCRSGRCPATWPGAGTTPAFSWISPNLCDDGHDAPCVTGAPGGLAQADRVPVAVGAEDHGRAGVPGRRPDRDHLRRGQRLGPAAARHPAQPRPPERAAARQERARRRPHRRGPAVPRSGPAPQHRGLQPLLAARTVELRPAAPGDAASRSAAGRWGQTGVHSTPGRVVAAGRRRAATTRTAGDIRVYQPSTRPGAPLPHAWIDDEDGRRRPVKDLVSAGAVPADRRRGRPGLVRSCQATRRGGGYPLDAVRIGPSTATATTRAAPGCATSRSPATARSWCARTGSSPGGTRPPLAIPGPSSPPRSARSLGADRLLRRVGVPDRRGCCAALTSVASGPPVLTSDRWRHGPSPPHQGRAGTRHPTWARIRLVSRASRQARRHAS